jgi:NodT family efflux transporter outer membrane factor (OMF) lipoprotein
MIRAALLCSAGAVLLAACANTPLPTLSPRDVPATFEQISAASPPIWPSPDWWRGFGDPQLSVLEASAEAGNFDIVQAAARLRQADARTRQAGAALVPAIGLNANTNSYYGQTGSTSQQETDWSAALAASYELDFWGKNRDAVDAATALRAASAADRATVALTVAASVADTYFQLLSLRERIAVAKANLNSGQQILDVLQRRVTAGYGAPSDLAQERATLAAEEGVVPALEQRELETRNALAILLGQPPEKFAIAGDSLGSLQTPTASPGLPSELLARRPDIATAEANLVAAHADLAAARVAFLPNISLTANGGIAYPALAAAVDTLPGSGLAAGLGASLVQVIFDGGKTSGRIAETEAREEELLAVYRAAVLSALSDVESALGNLDHLAAQEAALQNQVTQSEIVLSAAQRKYAAGYVDFLSVTDAERTLFTARDQLSDIKRARLTASVALFKALGGGWSSTG